VSGISLDLAFSWLPMAECRHEDTDLFFPDSREGESLAVAICNRCRARADCLAYALAHLELNGIWGGTADEERDLLRRAAAS